VIDATSRDRVGFEDDVRIAQAVDHSAREEREDDDVNEAAEPGKHHGGINDRLAQVLFAPDGENRLKVALERNEYEVGFRGADRRPDYTFTEKQHAEQVSA